MPVSKPITNKQQPITATAVAANQLDIPRGPGGRPLRVLHIGNIANNGYYNAKFLRRVGVEADVLCYDDYWIMSSPEWEEADFEGVPADHFAPDWWILDLKGYERPRWFVQGPFKLCVDYLLAKQQGRAKEARQLWNQLTEARQVVANPAYRREAVEVNPTSKRLVLDRYYQRLKGRVSLLLKRVNQIFHSSNNHHEPATVAPLDSFHQEFLDRYQWLIGEFARRFPERPDRLQMEDLTPYEERAALLKVLFQHYDLIQGYSTDPLYPMLANFKPYVAFEHGTLRDTPDWDWAYKGPFYDNPIGRLTALSYALADHVFITNADCLSSAQRLRLTSFEPMPHPLDETSFFPTEEHRHTIRAKLDTDLVFFCPIRHDWIDKGTDRYIRALPELRQVINRKFKVCFTPWGKEVERSRELISELQCNDLVEWVGPFGRVHLARWLSAADVVFDQLAFPSFSGITPRALACGTPVIAAYEHNTLAWMFPEPAPVLAARSTAEIVKQTVIAIEPTFRTDYAPQARAWIERYHSSNQVVKKMLDVYGSVVIQNI